LLRPADQVLSAGLPGFPSEEHSMRNDFSKTPALPPADLTPDFLGESRHEFVAKLAYQHWIGRGMPLGSPDVDWAAAERAMYESLQASGLISSPAASPQDMERKIYEE
jgi:hypothetical protein